VACCYSDYRRWYVPGGTYFFTVVAYGRRPILTTDEGRKFLREAIETNQQRRPFSLIATCLLPDHWHLVMQLPPGDADYSTRLKRIKEEFTMRWLNAGLPEATVTAAQRANGERGVWQPRFWEHTVQDEFELERCVDYVHWNPRKHRLVTRVRDWTWSSFHRFVAAGHYDIDWGGAEPLTLRHCTADWGEP
jgi:putative transposase